MTTRRTYRFLLTPKWVAFTLLVVAVVGLCLAAASWQWSRLHERRDRNAAVLAKQSLAPVPLTEAIALDAPLDDGDDAEWTIVTATGTYDPAAEVLVRNRAFDGAPGVHVITPLRLADGGGAAVLVNRGWLPRPPDPVDPVTPPEPLTGQVTVVGRVRATQEPGRFGDDDASSGVLRDVARVDIERLRQQTGYPLAPVFVELVSQDPVDPIGPTPVRPPTLDDGPHLSYAGQWLLFALLAVVGWGVVVRKTARGRRRQQARDSAVQTAIASRTAREMQLRNVRPVRRASEPVADDAGATGAGPPAPPLDEPAELPDEPDPGDGPETSIDPLLKPPAAPPSAPPEPAGKATRVARRELRPDPPGSGDEDPSHE